MPQNKKQNRAWVVAVNMGYGHERAAYPLRPLAQEGIIIANNYPGIPAADKRKWESSRKFYELISRAKQLPLVGDWLFNLYDREFQWIEPFYPKRDLSAPIFQLQQMYRMMRHGWGKNLIEYLNQKPELPLVSTFFVPAFFAEEHGYRGEIYCVLCDADVSRAWAPLNPKKTRIKYLAPNSRVVERLKLYGVPADNIFLTGFPLPQENIGGLELAILKKDLWRRIHHLDPQHHFINKYRESLVRYLGQEDGHHCNRDCGLTITFAVGGAGAQRELGREIMRQLKPGILKQQIKINLVAGIRNDVYLFFERQIRALGLQSCLGKNLNLIFALNKNDYFEKLNQALRTTDILWTKPSELAFYTGLGLPIIMAEPIGCQEFFNRQWLEAIGGGVRQGEIQYLRQWLPDWLNSGWLAEAALQGFLDAPKFGAYKIAEVIFGRKNPAEEKRVTLL